MIQNETTAHHGRWFSFIHLRLEYLPDLVEIQLEELPHQINGGGHGQHGGEHHGRGVPPRPRAQGGHEGAAEVIDSVEHHTDPDVAGLE